MPYATTNPVTNQIVKTFPDATDAEVSSALDRAQEAFPDWRDTPIAERAAIFKRAGQFLRERSDELVRLVTLEVGKLPSEGQWEVTELSATIFDWVADNAERVLRPRARVIPETGQEVRMTYQPQGIVLAVEPWNVPFYQAVRGFAPAAISGNVVLLKHSEIVPQCAQAIVELLYEAGLPKGVWQNLYATHKQVEGIIADPRIRVVTMTGSAAAGAHVASLAAKALRKSVLELGGADPFIVLKDADLEIATGGACARFTGSGQGCVLPKRFLVEAPVYDEFVKRYTQALGSLRPGDPTNPETTFGPQSSQAQADRIKAQISRAVAAGATAIEVGSPIPETGAFVQPTILTNVTTDNPIFYEEIFGPVPIIYRVADEDAAVALANDSPYGLGGSVWSEDIERATRIADRIDTGMVAINAPIPLSGNAQPFGGVKNSGFGRELGEEGILEFCNIKPVVLPLGAHGHYEATST